MPAAKRVNGDSDQVQRLARDLLSELAPGRLLLETTIKLGAHRLTALIDTGALSSHVSVRVSDKIELESIALPTPIVTVDASGSTHTVHAAPVARFSFVTGENNDEEFVYPLLPFPLAGRFDVILGMNFLQRHNAVVDAAARTVSVSRPNGDKLQIFAEGVDTAHDNTRLAMLCPRQTLAPRQLLPDAVRSTK